MKELGLDYGWGPTAFVQWNLEHLHVLLGTPWWASIALTAALARVILYKFYEQASDITARTQLIAPQVKVLRERTKAAREKQDMAAMMQATQEMKALYKMAGIKMLGSTGPLLQIPLAYGMFRLLRGMTALPVPGMEDGGILWITDLTVSDPFLILPTICAMSSFTLIRKVLMPMKRSGFEQPLTGIVAIANHCS